MRGYLDVFIVLLFAWSAFTAFTKKEVVGKKKVKLYTKESREKCAVGCGCIYVFLMLFTAFYALCNHGIIGINFNIWVFYGVFLVLGIGGVFACEKIYLKKSDEAVAASAAGRSNADEEEDF